MVRRQRISREVPDHRAQLVFHVEAEPVVDRPEATVGEEDMTALAIRVVGDDVEGREVAEHLVGLGIFSQGEVVLLGVFIDIELERARSERTVLSGHGGRDKLEADRVADDPGRDLSTPEPTGKIPERPLTTLGLVDRLERLTVEGDLDEQRRVRAVGEAGLDGDLAESQDLVDSRRHVMGARCPLVRGQS